MTANELADKCNRLQGEIILGFLADCATMLRQQAQEIEALKKELALQKLSDISQEIENEPVAWILNGIIHEFDPSDWAKEQYPDQDVIPLYTHVQKSEMSTLRELTDEEIEKTWHELYPLDSNSYWEDNRRGFCQRRFARAILKKASEK